MSTSSTVVIHAPAPVGAPARPGRVPQTCAKHGSSTGLCFVARVGPGGRIHLGRPQAEVPATVLWLPFGNPVGDDPWSGVQHVSALAAVVRIDRLTGEVLVTNLSRSHDLALTGDGMADVVLPSTPLGDRADRRPASASVVVSEARLEARQGVKSATVWLQIQFDAEEVWTRLDPTPTGRAARPLLGATALRPTDERLRPEGIAQLKPGSKKDLEYRRERRTAFAVALYRTAHGRALVERFLGDPEVIARFRAFEESEPAGPPKSTGGKRRRAPRSRPTDLIGKVREHLQKAEVAARIGEWVREPAPVLLALDVGRGIVDAEGHAWEADATGDRAIGALWKRLHGFEVSGGYAVEDAESRRGGSGAVHETLLELVLWHLQLDDADLVQHLAFEEGRQISSIGLVSERGRDEEIASTTPASRSSRAAGGGAEHRTP